MLPTDLNPLTGEKPLNGWIIALIIIAGVALIATILYPKFPKVFAFFKRRFKK